MNERAKSLKFIPFEPTYRKVFFELNKAWLEDHFLIEPYDLEVLSNPEKMVLEPGGDVYFGLLAGKAIATFALTPRGESIIELNKMAVHNRHRGLGFGHQMMEFIVGLCRQRELQTIELYSHSSLQSALHLYKKFGFKTIPMPTDCIYDRADTRMQMIL